MIKDNELVQDFSFYDLFIAYRDCRKHKRNTMNAIEFEFNLEKNLWKLYEDLKSGKYEIGQSICFIVPFPKPREVWAANFRDRIVHHLLYNALKERYFKRFTRDTYSCIPRRGTLNAARAAFKYSQSVTDNYLFNAYYLKADIKNFFMSIDKKILFSLFDENVKEKWILDLLKQIIFHDPRKNSRVKSKKWKFNTLPKHKSLWNTPLNKGLPIGNLTSQFFSNVYLDKLDRFAKHTLQCSYYCRYVDDFMIFHKSPRFLMKCFDKILRFLKEKLLLDLHVRKKTVGRIIQGFDFVGYTIKPNRMCIKTEVLERFFAVSFPCCENFFSYLGLLAHTKGFFQSARAEILFALKVLRDGWQIKYDW